MIVQDYLYEDVATLIAPGGTGKTTLLLYEAVHIVLSRALYGREITKPGPVVLVTAEDTRSQCIARLREISLCLGLDEDEQRMVRKNVRIKYVGGETFRLCAIYEDVVTNSDHLDDLIDWLRDIQPVLVNIDPLVSFGVGEARVNDNEQGLINAARRIRDRINCCVRYVHHTGKQNARDGAVDQYAGRNGSALPDGSRMVAVMQRCSPEEWLHCTSKVLTTGSEGFKVALPKISYTKPQENIYLERDGFGYVQIFAENLTMDEQELKDDNTLLEFINTKDSEEVWFSKEGLKNQNVLPEKRTRAALSRLEARNLIQIEVIGPGKNSRIKPVM